jgi:hypothetical protein
MILAGILASATNFIANLLLFPLIYFYLKTSPKKLYRAFVVDAPLAVLSTYHLYLGHGFMYYLNYHLWFSKTYWKMNPISLPFESLIKALTGSSTSYPVSPLALFYVLALLALYFFSAILSWKLKDTVSLSYSMPFLLFLTVYQAWFFIPRYIVFCFPLLFAYRDLLNKKAFLVFALLLAIGGTIYSVYYLSVILSSQL